MPANDLVQIAEDFRAALPGEALPPDVMAKLAKPTDAILNAAAEAAIKAGYPGAAEVLYRGVAARPNAPFWPLSGLARLAAANEDWPGALNFWTECQARDDTRPFIHFGRATALARLWRLDEAMAVWRDILERFPDAEGLYVNVAGSAGEIGQWAFAGACIETLLARMPDEAKPDWFQLRIRALQHQGRDADVQVAIALLQRDFPDSDLGMRLSVERAVRIYSGLDELHALTAAAVAKFPSSRGFYVEHVRNLLGLGRVDEAEAVVAKLEEEDDHVALVGRWRLIVDQDGDDAIKAQALAARGRIWGLYPGLLVGEFLLSLWRDWSLELALGILSDIEQRFPGRPVAVASRIKALVALRRDDEALAAIDAVPALCETHEMLELRGWAASRRGAVDEARRINATILSRSYCAAIHSPEPNLELIRLPEGLEDRPGVTAIVFIRNEARRLAEFLAHHREIGVRRFVVIDHMSTDGSHDYLRAQPDIILYRTGDPFRRASSGMRWKNVLIQRHIRDGWCLPLDVDEAFIYPGWETTPIDAFTAYLDSVGAEGVRAFMLDVYPERLFTNSGEASPQSEYRHYDGDYAWLGHLRSPYRQPIGGVRTRLFGAQDYLTKTPLIKAGRGIHLNSHETTPLRLAEVSGVLLHYKLLSLAEARSRAGAGSETIWSNLGPDDMRRQERSFRHLAAMRDTDLTLPGVTESLTDSLTLAERGLMEAPPDYRTWISKRSA
jgi:tetratricopeptide (TPR) repeat protein